MKNDVLNTHYNVWHTNYYNLGVMTDLDQMGSSLCRSEPVGVDSRDIKTVACGV